MSFHIITLFLCLSLYVCSDVLIWGKQGELLNPVRRGFFVYSPCQVGFLWLFASFLFLSLYVCFRVLTWKKARGTASSPCQVFAFWSLFFYSFVLLYLELLIRFGFSLYPHSFVIIILCLYVGIGILNLFGPIMKWQKLQKITKTTWCWHTRYKTVFIER